MLDLVPQDQELRRESGGWQAIADLLTRHGLLPDILRILVEAPSPDQEAELPTLKQHLVAIALGKKPSRQVRAGTIGTGNRVHAAEPTQPSPVDAALFPTPLHDLEQRGQCEENKVYREMAHRLQEMAQKLRDIGRLISLERHRADDRNRAEKRAARRRAYAFLDTESASIRRARKKMDVEYLGPYDTVGLLRLSHLSPFYGMGDRNKEHEQAIFRARSGQRHGDKTHDPAEGPSELPMRDLAAKARQAKQNAPARLALARIALEEADPNTRHLSKEADRILPRVNELLTAEGHRAVSARTLNRRLKAQRP